MSRRPFLIAFGTATVAAAAIYFARSASLRWGTRPVERTMSLPGDDIVPTPSLEATRAITISATPDEIWPWLAQLGFGRGGFYSYDGLENLIGLNIHSAQHIEPDWQDIAPGDTVHLAEPVALEVFVAQPGHALVIGGVPDDDDPAPMPYAFSWAFVILPADAGTCRLIVRERYSYLTPWAPLMVEPIEWLSFLMTQRMLRGIKSQAEHPPTVS